MHSPMRPNAESATVGAFLMLAHKYRIKLVLIVGAQERFVS